MKFQELKRTLKTTGIKVTSKSNTLVVKGAETTLENLVDALNKLDKIADNAQENIQGQFWAVREQICTAIANKAEESKNSCDIAKINKTIAEVQKIKVKYNKVNFVSLLEFLNNALKIA